MTFWTGGMMAAGVDAAAELPVFVGGEAASGFSDVTIDKPAGVASGMHMIGIYFNQNTGTATTPPGWTSVYNGIATGNTGVAVYRKIASGSEPSSYSFSGGGTGSKHATIIAYEGGQGLVDVVGTKTEASSTTTTAGSISPSKVGVLIAAFIIESQSRTVFGPPGGMVQRSFLNSDSLSHAVYDLSPSPAGATGDKTLTWTGAAAATAGISLQIY